MSGLPMEALDAQVDLFKWTMSETGIRYNFGWFESEESKRPSDFTDELFVKAQLRALNLGETFAVSEEICEVLQAAAQTVPDFELRREDLPSEEGFIYLERGLAVPDLTGKTVVTKALTWQFVVHQDGQDVGLVPRTSSPPTGVMIILYSDPDDPRDHMHDEWEQDIRSRLGSNRLLTLSFGSWKFGEPPFAQDEIRKWFMAYLRFIGEPWIDTRMIEPSRQAAKRAARVRISPEVNVIHLRKEREHHPHNPNPQEVMWSHRWLVRGHWRNQWYASEQRHAPKWIHPHVKGPESMPLIVKDKVFHVDR